MVYTISKVLSVYSITLLLIKERGPFNIFGIVREYFNIFKGLDHEGNPITYIDSDNNIFKDEIALVLTCPICFSLWISVLILIIPKWIINICSIWGATIILIKLMDEE